MHTILLEELSLPVTVGVHEYEKKAPQTLKITLEIQTDLHAAMQSDDLNDTLDYSAIINAIGQALTDKHFHLIEKVSDTICTIIEQEFCCYHYRLTIAKPDAMINLKSAQVIVDKRRLPRG